MGKVIASHASLGNEVASKNTMTHTQNSPPVSPRPDSYRERCVLHREHYLSGVLWETNTFSNIKSQKLVCEKKFQISYVTNRKIFADRAFPKCGSI